MLEPWHGGTLEFVELTAADVGGYHCCVEDEEGDTQERKQLK